ncbi:MAG: hypothetical protein GY835_01775 [bacterium]|nr:hypothetical protein [bacterium]
MRHPTAHLKRFVRALLLTAILAASQASANVDVLYPYNHGGRLCLNLWASNLLDDRTASTIESGLPGTCVYHIRLLDSDGATVTEHLIELSLRLDLWENLYLLQEEEQISFNTLAAADSAWSHREGIVLCALGELAGDAEYRVEAQVVVTPLAAEDRARLSRYVTSNSSRKREELSLDLGGLFGQLLRRANSDDNHTGFTSPLFRIRNLEERR